LVKTSGPGSIEQMNSMPAGSRIGAHLVDEMLGGVVATVAADMRGQQASLVYQILRETVARRLPGIAVDHETLRLAAARIAVGLTPTA
jgi:hypothetical protein